MPLDVSVTVPDDWFFIPVAPGETAALLDALVDEMVDVAEARSEIRRGLRAVAAEAEAANARFVIGYFDIVEEEPYVIAANGALSSLPAPEQLQLGMLETALRGRDIETEILDTPGGACLVRRERAGRLLPDTDQLTEVYSAMYYLPSGGEVIVLSLTTPTMALVDEFSALFDAIAETIEVSPVPPTPVPT
jgi:hypothetical protein